jgi:glycosyltransferase involved in cell wall biosynthesis
MRVLHLMSCRGWSSDAYWAARVSAELERAGHEVTLACRRGTESRVMERASEAGATRIVSLRFASGVKPLSDLRDLATLRTWLAATDIVHVHRGKEHWLAALANRFLKEPPPLVRTRHIVQAVRPHALNRWLYREATGLVVTVTEAIRQQYVAAELAPPDRVVALPGGVDLRRFHPKVEGAVARRSLGGAPNVPLIGLVSGLRVMKGHLVTIEALRRLAADRSFQVAFIGQGTMESMLRHAIASAGLADRVRVVGFVPDLPAAMAALDLALYPALESDGMSRVLFEYLAMGKPVVASRVGVVPEVLVHRESALLVPAGDVPRLAEAIASLLDDGALRARLGAAAGGLARARLSGAVVARALATQYRHLLVAAGRVA